MKAGWNVVALETVCRKITDGSHNPAKGVDFSDHIMLSSKNVFDDRITLDSPRYLTKTDFDAEDRRTSVQVDDVLLTIVGTVGRAAVVGPKLPKFTLQRSVAVLRPHRSSIEPRFLMYALQSILEDLLGGARGVAQKGVYLKSLRKMSIPLPPLEEQQRIVTILDEAFAGLGRAKANAEANLASAKELFQAALGEAFNPPEAVKAGWEEVDLGSLCRIARGGSPRPIKAFLTDADDGINWIKIGDTQAGGRYIDNTAERIRPEGKAKSRFVEPGAFLLSNSMSFGRPYILRTSGCIHDGWLVLDPDYERVDQAFLYYSLIAPMTYAQFDRAAAGSTVRNLNTTLASKVTVPLPPLDEQERIVERLDRLKEFMSDLESRYAEAISDLDQLRQSLLAQAFEGELT